MPELTKCCIYAILISFFINIILSPIVIPYLRKIKLGQYERAEGPKSHLKKEGTPTMGGVIILLGVLISGSLFINGNPDLIAILVITIGYGIIGFIDDFIKVVMKRSLGLRAYQKIILQLLVAGMLIYYVTVMRNIGTEIIVPFTNGAYMDLGALFIPFLLFVIIGTVNSVNLTDGLDGLATGVTILVATFFGTIAMVSYPAAAPLVCTVIGSLLGFLLFNAYPAKIFMGDTGSLALGGFLVSLAVIMKMPLFLAIVGIIYVAESMSDIIQVASYKLFKKRVFKMAPLHHHFEILGWKETKVVAVFFIVTAIACLIGYLGI